MHPNPTVEHAINTISHACNERVISYEISVLTTCDLLISVEPTELIFVNDPMDGANIVTSVMERLRKKQPSVCVVNIMKPRVHLPKASLYVTKSRPGPVQQRVFSFEPNRLNNDIPLDMFPNIVTALDILNLNNVERVSYLYTDLHKAERFYSLL